MTHTRGEAYCTSCNTWFSGESEVPHILRSGKCVCCTVDAMNREYHDKYGNDSDT